MLNWLLILTTAAALAAEPEWEVRYGRTTDAETAGGFPVWTVTLEGDPRKPTVRIKPGDAASRGTVLIGRRVTVGDGLLALDFQYTTLCALENRCGRVELATLTPEAWDALAKEPAEAAIFDVRSREVTLGYVPVQDHTGPDITEPKPLDDTLRLSQALPLRRQAGKEVVLAVVWTGLHTAAEEASLVDLEVTDVAPSAGTKDFFARLDLDRPELEQVKAALAQSDEAGAAALVEYYRHRGAPFLPNDPRQQQNPTVSDRLREEADAALESRFIGQSSYGLQPVPEPIDWSYNPGQDPEWTWQFNRHSAWRALAQTYLATGDETYAARWVELMRDWVANNPPGTPWSWRTIETGIRQSVWPAVYFSFVDSPSFKPEDHLLFLSALANHAEYLLPESRFRGGSNWGMIESEGLFHTGLFFPEFERAKTWRDTAWSRIAGEMEAQVLPDGAQVELTTSYHFGVLGMFVKCAQLAELGGYTVPESYEQRLEKMYEYGMKVIKPDGTTPMLGDSWPGNIRGTLVAGARRYDRADMRYVGTAGKEGERPESLDSALPDAGYYVMRTGWVDPRDLYVLTDVAHIWGGGHQQPDALQINLYGYGQTLLPDSGSYLYYGPDRAFMGRTSSHSTVTVDEQNQNTNGARLNAFLTAPGLGLVDGEHDGYEGVTHRRQVLFRRPERGPAYLLVVDRLTGAGRHTLDQNWHFLPAPFVLDAENRTARTIAGDGPNLLIRSLAPETVKVDPIESYVSYRYTIREPRPAIRVRQVTELPATFVTLLLPYPTAEPPELAVTLLDAAPGVVAAEVTGDGWRERLFLADEPGEVTVGDWTASGRAGVAREGEAPEVLE